MRILNNCENRNTSNFVELYYSVCVGDAEAVFCEFALALWKRDQTETSTQCAKLYQFRSRVLLFGSLT